MIQTNEILIGSQCGDRVSITISSQGFESWHSAEIEIHCDGWVGHIRGSFMAGELGRFAHEVRKLYKSLAGTAELHPIEPNLILTLKGDGKGHVEVTGTGTNHFESGTSLQFRFDIDQTYLVGIAEALAAADPKI